MICASSIEGITVSTQAKGGKAIDVGSGFPGVSPTLRERLYARVVIQVVSAVVGRSRKRLQEE
jgi:hypothetical protein